LYRRSYHTDRVIGFCLCISRNVIDEVGGIDTRYPIGNFEDDDFSLRVRAAGYEIVVCEDSFIHHFGNASFKANNVDYGSQLEQNWKIFAQRWDLPRAYPTQGYDSSHAIARGFDRARDYIALPDSGAVESGATVARTYDTVLLAVLASEEDWSRLAPVIANYARAYSASDSMLLAIGLCGGLDAQTVAERAERAIRKAGAEPEGVADIDISDVSDLATWSGNFGDARLLSIFEYPGLPGMEIVKDRSRSGLRRLTPSRETA
jgi:hypothetical protein